MIYVRCGLLDGAEEVHRESEAVLCQFIQEGGGTVNLFWKYKS